MIDTRLYIASGVQTFVVVVGMTVNFLQYRGLSMRMDRLEARMLALENRLNFMFDRFESGFRKSEDR
jgi:hypothetical protein